MNSKELTSLIERHKASRSNPRNTHINEQFNSIYSEQLHKPVSPKNNKNTIPYLVKLKQKVNKKKRDKSKQLAMRFPLIVEDDGNGLVMNGMRDNLRSSAMSRRPFSMTSKMDMRDQTAMLETMPQISPPLSPTQNQMKSRENRDEKVDRSPSLKNENIGNRNTITFEMRRPSVPVSNSGNKQESVGLS